MAAWTNEYILDSQDIVIKGFLCSEISQSIDNGKPYLDESDERSNECSSSDDSAEVDTSEQRAKKTDDIVV